MIRNTEQVRGLVEGAVGTAYIGFPQTKMPKTVRGKPWAVVTLIDSIPIFTDRNGTVVQSLLTYGIRVFASSPRELLDVCEAVESSLRGILDMKGMSPEWADPVHGLCRTLVFDRVMDIRNNTFRS